MRGCYFIPHSQSLALLLVLGSILALLVFRHELLQTGRRHLGIGDQVHEQVSVWRVLNKVFLSRTRSRVPDEHVHCTTLSSVL